MSWNPALDPDIPLGDAVETVVVRRARDLGGSCRSAGRAGHGPRRGDAGGTALLWWDFVASSRDRIDAVKEAWRAGDWAHGRFRLPPGNDAEFIPAPER